MNKADVAVIGGTGIGERLAHMGGEAFSVETRFGQLQGRVVLHEGVRVAAVQRHSAGHKTPPHKVNYRALGSGLKELGVKACLASAAVGSLHPEWEPGTFAVCTDFIDLTFRRVTLFDDTVVHTDFSVPFPAAPALREALTGMEFQPEAVYLGGDGPRYETPAEIRMMQRLGADVVGMTASSEAIVMREAGVPYGCLAVVTNLAAGLTKSELHHGEVTDVMRAKGAEVLDALLRAATLLAR